MARLATLDQAKDHLREWDDTHNADVDRKLVQASAIVLDYLKSRANETAVITSSSVAAASVITTPTAHGFTTGDTVVITGHTGSTPDLNGSYVLTVLSSLTFSVPVTVTIAGTGGLATVEWTAATVPGPVQAAMLLMLSHLYEHRGDNMLPDAALWEAVANLCRRFRDPALV